MATTYRIVDEPQPGRFSKFVTHPSTIFVAGCLGGSWVALPWFAFNAIALGSVTQKKELRLAALSPILSVVVAFFLIGLIDTLQLRLGGEHALGVVLGLPDRAASYAVVVILAIKVWILYVVKRDQEKSFAIFEYMGGKFWGNTMGVAAAAYFVRPYVIKAAFAISLYLGIAVL